MKKDYQFKINFFILSLISLGFFIGKWTISFSIFPEEDLFLKVITDSRNDGAMYFHYVKSLASLDFKNNFHPDVVSSDYIMSPIGSIIFHTFLFKIFGIKSFIILELISIFAFLLIFFLIFKQFEISDLLSILLASLMFVLPLMVSKLNILNIEEINTFANNFYNLRFPRPLVSQLYFFLFIYILIISSSDNILKIKYLLPLSAIAALSLSSFFFVFCTQLISFLIFLLIKYKKKIFNLIKYYYKNIIISCLVFLFLIAPFVILLANTNESYNSRLGIFSINLNDKIFLIKHYLLKLTRLKILILYFIIFILCYLHKKYFKKNKNIINIFLIIFISSILSPMLFIVLANKVSFLYHFNNLVVVSVFLLLIIIFLAFSIEILSKYKFPNFFQKFPILIIIIMISLYNVDFYFKNFNKINNDKGRYEKNKIIKLIKKNNKLDIENSNLLSFDNEILIWSILNNIKYLKILDGTFSIKDDHLTETDLIEVFKFLKLKKENFIDFLANKKKGYRYINSDARQIFWQKYQANSLFTYMNSDDFEKETLDFIKSSSPFYAHQFAIPRFEMKRLINKFDLIKNKENFYPDIVVINLENNILNNYKLNMVKYCKAFKGNYYSLYFAKNYCQ
tara:strand:+ start:230 stop:2098 length:1869 start_codon:yes stop_codon:yes gene_type:complete